MSDDGQPLRRSMRLIGATPLKPMREIMPSEQLARAGRSPSRGRSRSRSRSRSRGGTPSKRATAGSKAPLTESRLRQSVNLPSDISSSDFLGDTPTARFYRPAAARTVEDTIVAKRSTGAGADNLNLLQQTVKARRIARQTSNVFLRPSSRTSDEEDGIGVFVSILPILRWMSDFAKGATLGILSIPLWIVNKWNTKLPLLIVGLTSVLIVAYAISQLDWRLAQQIGSTIIHDPRTAPGKAPPSSKTGKNFDYKFDGKVEGNLKNLRDRLAEVEASINETKAHAMGSDELVRSNVQSIETRLATLGERGALLDTKISSLELDLRQIGAGLAEFQGVTGELVLHKEMLSSMQDIVKSLQRDLTDIRTAVSDEMLQNMIRSYLAEYLPQQLLVRKASDGTVQLDSSLLRLLHDMFASRPHPDDTASTSSTTASTAIGSSSSISWHAVESLLDGKLGRLEHQVVSREEIAEIVTKKLLAEVGDIKKLAAVDRASIDGKLSSFEAKIPKMNLLKDEIAALIQKSLDEKSFEATPDGIGIADYALESMGTRVVPSRTSPAYISKQDSGLLASLLSSPYYYGRGRPAKTALNPDTSLGNCWALAGSAGNLTISLGSPMIPTHFSIDHVSAALQVDRSSAPRKVQVFGYAGRNDKEIFLGEYEYSLRGPATQTFAAQFVLGIPVQFIKLVINTNHGRTEYTCLYRFRVHSLPHHNGDDPDTMYIGDLQ